jgi:membrane protein required for colicin V production
MDALPPPALVDVIAVALIALAALHGSFRGLSGELASLVATVAAFWFGVHGYQPVGAWMDAHSRLHGRPAFALAFATVIVAGVLIMLVLRWALKRIIRVVVEPTADRVCGTLAGGVRGALWVTALFILANLSPNTYLNRKLGEESLVGTLVMRALPHGRELLEEWDASHGGAAADSDSGGNGTR